MEIIYKKPFLKKFDKYPKTLKQQIITAIEKIPEGDIVRLKGNNIPPLYRLRVRDYRILFEMNEILITIWQVDSRGDIYKNV